MHIRSWATISAVVAVVRFAGVARAQSERTTSFAEVATAIVARHLSPRISAPEVLPEGVVALDPPKWPERLERCAGDLCAVGAYQFSVSLSEALAVVLPFVGENRDYEIAGRVRDATAYPYRAICYVNVVYVDGTRASGTGFFVKPRLIMTAAHVLKDAPNPAVRTLSVTPAWNGGAPPYGSDVPIAYKLANDWKFPEKPTSADVAWIILENDSLYRRVRKSIDPRAIPDKSLKAAQLTTAGYPSVQMHADTKHVVESVQRGTFSTNRIVAEGQSGSPLYFYAKGDAAAVGIVSQKFGDATLAARITPARIKETNVLDRRYPRTGSGHPRDAATESSSLMNE